MLFLPIAAPSSFCSFLSFPDLVTPISLELLILIWSCRSFILLQLPILPRSCHSYIHFSFLSLSDLAAPSSFCSFLSFPGLATPSSSCISFDLLQVLILPRPFSPNHAASLIFNFFPLSNLTTPAHSLFTTSCFFFHHLLLLLFSPSPAPFFIIFLVLLF